MQIVVIADDYPPKKSSAAIQIKDLAEAFTALGYKVTIIIPGSMTQKEAWVLEFRNDIQVLRLRTLETKDVSFFRRAISEFLMPFFMIYGFKKSPISNIKFDGLVWYSPSIFLSLFASFLKTQSCCKSYLILRDIFPKWAVDLGLLRKNSVPYLFFKMIADYQFRVANTIGVQSAGNLPFVKIGGKNNAKVEVLHNWIAPIPAANCRINIANSALAGRFIFVYAGNMGVAQGIEVLLNLASSLMHRLDIGFLFVGRGSHFDELKSLAAQQCLTNVLFFDEIDASEIPALYAQCNIGLIALDQRHETHNIPGKFLSYMDSGLPVLAAINPGNDLEGLIKKNHVGMVCPSNSLADLKSAAEFLVELLKEDLMITHNCRALAKNLFSPKVAAKQIINSLN